MWVLRDPRDLSAAVDETLLDFEYDRRAILGRVKESDRPLWCRRHEAKLDAAADLVHVFNQKLGRKPQAVDATVQLERRGEPTQLADGVVDRVNRA